jgi:TIR domain
MNDVFISYASEDRERAHQLASALAALGWSVWWDRKIITGQPFDEAIERELETAKSVVVLWSTHSIGSEWVKNEAAVAAERGVLVPALIDNVKLPLEFRRKQTADLVGWDGDTSHYGFQALCEGVSAKLGGAPRPHPIGHRAARPDRTRRRTSVMVFALALTLGLGIYAVHWWRTTAAPGSQDRGSEVRAALQQDRAADAAGGLADLVVGTYAGAVVADSKGGSRSDVILTITKLDNSTVRVTSDYSRLGAVDVTLTRIGGKIMSAGGNTTLLLDLEQHPPALAYNPDGEVAYHGNKQ